MKFVAHLVSFLVAIVLVGGCASTKVTEREILVTEKVPRPDHILIYDFAATPADVPARWRCRPSAGVPCVPRDPPHARAQAAGSMMVSISCRRLSAAPAFRVL
jgi:hypothetical protein